MSSKTTDTERLAAMEKRFEELTGYFDRFEAAFDELHQAVARQAKTPGKHISTHHDYPVMSTLGGGFPSFYEAGYYSDDAPPNYLSTMQPPGGGLLAVLGGYRRPEIGFPKGAELAEFLRTHEIGKRLNLKAKVLDGKQFDWPVDRLVGDAVERYFHLHGLEAPIDPKRRSKILWPLVRGTLNRKLNLRLMVPINLTHFGVDHFPLSETTYITRISKKLQLSRARMRTFGTGAVQSVVGAATHAFVSTGWHLEVNHIDEVYQSLNQSSPNVIDAIDTFFGALRIATGISTGYSQIVWIPKQWALDYFCDLTPIYGTTLRHYPSYYDDYGWVRQGATVTRGQLEEVRRIYRALTASNSEAVRLALRRLNGCLTRTDAADAILDGTIGLELLLGDDQNQSLSYKLRLRAGALALLQAESARRAVEIAGKVKRLYGARSSIVHGVRKKGSKRASEPADTSHAVDRKIASDLLRFVLDVLLTHPEYLEPSKIDEDLLLGASVAPPPKSSSSRRKPFKKKD